jgi:hypothetical protein
MYTLKFVGVSIHNRIPNYRSILQFGAVYSIRRLSRVEKENVTVQINANNFIVCDIKNLRVHENGILNQYVLPDP